MSGSSAITRWKETGGVAVLFDFGGTLDADGVPWKERFYRLYRDEGTAVPPERFDPLFYAVDDALTGSIPSTLSFRDTVRGLVGGVTAALGMDDPALAERITTQFVADALERLRHNARLLETLSRRYRLGVVSNFYGNLTRVCEDAGIRPFFTAVVDSARSGYVKPDPRIFYHTVEGLKTDPSRALFVGDSLRRDMAGARAVGMPHIWLTPAPSHGQRPCCPEDTVIHCLDELEELLL